MHPEAQPDASYYIGENADIVPWGTSIIDLDIYSPPDLVIEVANTSLPDDKGEKRLLYEDLRVKNTGSLTCRTCKLLLLPSRTMAASELPSLRCCQAWQ